MAAAVSEASRFKMDVEQAGSTSEKTCGPPKAKRAKAKTKAAKQRV